MARLTDPSGAIVSVADEKAERLVKQGWKPVDEPKKTPSKKTAAKKTASSKSEK